MWQNMKKVSGAPEEWLAIEDLQELTMQRKKVEKIGSLCQEIND